MLSDYKEKIKNKLSVVPFEPGCYLMKDRNDQVIYVGKAKRLEIDYVHTSQVHMMQKLLGW